MQTHNSPTTYIVSGAQTSPIFGKAFAEGCGGIVATNTELLDGSVAMFGHPNLMPLLSQARSERRDWYYGDKAYFGRTTHYRITKNAFMHDGNGEPSEYRWRRLGISVQSWHEGADILLCPQSESFFTSQGKSAYEWIRQTSELISEHTDRKIRIHYKNGGNRAEIMFKQHLKNVWAVVVHSSMAGVQAVIHGVPCFATDPESTAARFGSTDLSLIESPVKPDNREHMAMVLANNQFTISEINSGYAWEQVK